MLHIATIIMAAAVLVVSVSKKIGLGSILGYILAGLIIGPWGLNFITNSQSILHFSEIGVILLLFIIGLELQPSRLWVLRKSIFGLGTAQVLFTTLVIASVARLFIDSWITAIVVGVGLSLSSTAFALQLLAEKQHTNSPHGHAALHTLLFQDLAAIPALALIPIIVVNDISTQSNITVSILKTIAILISFWLFARYLLRPILRFIAKARTHEIFTAAALLLVLGSALVMQSVGISMALGAFLAGVLVADSEYRHQLEADIEPFKGLLLGLFFIAVGMSTNVGLLIEQPSNILLIVLGIVLTKGVILFLIGLFFAGLKNKESMLFAICLSQGGEFGFILFALAAEHLILTTELKDLLIVAVTLSMVTTPIILFVYEQIIQRIPSKGEESTYDSIDAIDSKIILAGYGRFGQIISRIIRTQGIYFTAIERDPGHVDFVRKHGNKVYYGDASNKRLLDTANIDKADIFVLAIGNIESSIKVAELVKREYPDIKLYARAHNRMHEMRLRALGAEVIIRDTLLSSMYLAEKILVSLNLSPEKAAEVKERFYLHDIATLNKQFAYRDDQKMLIQTSREASKELEGLFSEDNLTYSEVEDNPKFLS